MKPFSIVLLFSIAPLLSVTVSFLTANPFDPRFIITSDELCADGDLALSIPLMRIRLDDSTTLTLRAEHVLKTGGYGFARSEIVLCPLSTTIAPHDRDALLWRKPDGTAMKLRRLAETDGMKPPLSPLPGDTRLFLEAQQALRRAYAGQNAFAWVAAGSFGRCVVFFENFIFHYENGSLVSFTLPSGIGIAVKSEEGRFCELRAGGVPVFTLAPVSNRETRIAASGLQIAIVHDGKGRIVRIVRPNGAELARFEYDGDGFLASAEYRGANHRYTWAETRRPMPALINWVKSHHIQSVDDKLFDYKVTGGTITMGARKPGGPCKNTVLHVRYGTIISIKEKTR